MGKFVLPFCVLLICATLAFWVFTGRIPAESGLETLVGIAVLLIMAVGYLIISYLEEKE